MQMLDSRVNSPNYGTPGSNYSPYAGQQSGGGYGAPQPPANPGQPNYPPSYPNQSPAQPAYPPPYSPDGTGQPASPPYSDGGAGQSASPPGNNAPPFSPNGTGQPSSPSRSPAPTEKEQDFDQDVPF
jgi:hypothetical protein